MKWRNVFTIYAKELKDALRDRRTLVSTIVIPTLVMPLLTLGVGTVASGVISKARDEIPAIAIIGGNDSPQVIAQLEQSGKFKVRPAGIDWKQAIADKKIRAAVEIPAGFEAGLKAGGAQPVVIYHYEGEMKSQFGMNVLENFFRELRDKTVSGRLVEKSLEPSFVRPFEMKRTNVAPPEKVGGNLVGGFVPYLIIILCLTGAAVPATDLTAGEKERGTMETLLCSPVARVEIVLGKFLTVLTGSLSAMVLALASMGLTVVIAGSVFGGGARTANVTEAAGRTSAGSSLPLIDPAGVLGVLAMVLPVAVMFSALTFAIGLFAKSAKEAQSYLAPLMFVVLTPAIIGLLPGIDLNAWLALVPLLNLSLVCREMLSGVWHWSYIALIFGSSCVYAAAALGLAVRMFNREDVIFRT